eukprot:maker-scaffold109_size355148-snap-gene-2.24 protein:Tk11044 transcript:maker-scaffold109_size355148-snap-gene-2.24-mRNA-1 annotation:"gst-n-metaxin-like protein"
MPNNGQKVEKDTVVLHQFDRGRTCPSPSPYPIKLETYLRMAKLKYENDFKKPMSKKGKSPWISLNGQDVADSQLAQEHIAKHFNLDFSAHLSPADKAIARGMRAILEDHLYFCYAYERWVLQSGKYIKEYFAPFPIPSFLTGLVLKRGKGTVKQQCEGQGLGRHSQADQEKMAQMDLKSVSDYLADKPFLMGDKPTEVDCVLFGFSTIAIYCTPKHSVYYKAPVEDFPNLKDHNDRMRELFWPDWDEIGIVAISVVGTGYVLFKAKQWYSHRQFRKKWDNAPEDAVVLHQFDRALTCPSASPYVLKLETYLRAAKIKYVTYFDQPQGAKGKSPWMTINGQDIADSQLCINFLNKKFHVDLDSHLSDQDRAISHALRIMTEEHFIWTFALDRYCFSQQDFTRWFALPGIPKCALNLIFRSIRGMIRKAAWVQGMGRHSREDIEGLGLRDLKILSDALGDKKYFLGNERYSEADIAIFSVSAEILYCSPEDSVYTIALNKDFPNLVRHTQTIKEQFWPDWESPKNNHL